MARILTLTLTLATACGACGTKQLLGPAADADMQWDTEPELQTITATFDYTDAAGEAGTLTLTGDAWRALENEHDLQDVLAEVRGGSDVEGALRSQMDQVEATYTHCGQSWTSMWSCACDDECPVCGADIVASDSRTLAGLVANRAGEFDYAEKRVAA